MACLTPRMRFSGHYAGNSTDQQAQLTESAGGSTFNRALIFLILSDQDRNDTESTDATVAAFVLPGD